MDSIVFRGAFRALLALVVVGSVAEIGVAQENVRGETVLLGSLSDADRAVVERERRTRDAEANAQIAEARRLESEQEWRRAATLYESAGRLREGHDARAAQHFADAARAYFNAGDDRTASRLSELAGDRALEMGDVYTAALQLRQAAVLRTSGRDRIAAQQLGWRACRLSASPFLSDEQRAEIRDGLTNCTRELARGPSEG